MRENNVHNITPEVVEAMEIVLTEMATCSKRFFSEDKYKYIYDIEKPILNGH